MSIASILNWFAGDGAYMRLSSCMHRDWFWIGLTITLDLSVAVGYLVIASQWWKDQRQLDSKNPARQALGNLRNIFLFCGLCGYVFIPIKMFWPAWRLYDLFMLALVYFTWRYALQASNLRVVYNQLGQTEKLAGELDRTREEGKRRNFFLNAVSHDLRTPLNGLMLQSAVAEMAADHNDSAMLRESLSQMKTTARVAADLLNRLLELGRVDGTANASVARETDMAALIGEAIQRLTAEAGAKKLSLNSNLPDALVVRTDPVRMSRVLDNLLSNAIKFTEAGQITVAAGIVGSGLQFSVTDTGIGIAPEHVEHLFDEFYQVENAERNHAKGFGLGLAIVRRLCEQLGAECTVASRPGFGSTFTVTLADCLVERPPREPSGTRVPAPAAVG